MHKGSDFSTSSPTLLFLPSNLPSPPLPSLPCPPPLPFLLALPFPSLPLPFPSLYVLYVNSLSNMWLQIFSPTCGLTFYSLDGVLWGIKVFKFDDVYFISFSLCCLWFWCHSQEITAKSNIRGFFPYVFLLRVFYV